MSNSPSTALSATGYATVLPREIINGSDADVVDANVHVVNAMYAELLDVGEIAPDALRSYYVDFYLTQALGGGFAQYVFTAPERGEIDAYIRAGLENMGAGAHLALFNRTVAAFDALSEEEADAILKGTRIWKVARTLMCPGRGPAPGGARRRVRGAAGNRRHRRAQRRLAAGPGRTSWSWTRRNSTATSPSGCPDPGPRGAPGRGRRGGPAGHPGIRGDHPRALRRGRPHAREDHHGRPQL